jgi:virginiamycin B lyase
MKLTVAVCLATVLAACSPPGTSGSQAMPGTAFSSSALSPETMKLTGSYFIPSMGALDVSGMTNGPGRSIWFTEFEGDAIGKVTTAGVITTYATAANAQPYGIAVTRSRKRTWAGGYGGTMIATTSAGVQTAYPIAGSHIGDVLLGPDKNIWFTDYGNNKIGRISASGVATEFALPAGASPEGMTLGPDGNFWITDGGRRKVIKESPSGVALASYGKGITNAYLANIVAAPDGNLYFSEYADNRTLQDKIARITPKGKITEIGSLPPDAYPNRLAIGKDKNVYFAIGQLQAVGKITLSTGKVTFHYLPLTGNVGTNSIVNGPDDRLWLGGASTIYAVSY